MVAAALAAATAAAVAEKRVCLASRRCLWHAGTRKYLPICLARDLATARTSGGLTLISSLPWSRSNGKSTLNNRHRRASTADGPALPPPPLPLPLAFPRRPPRPLPRGDDPLPDLGRKSRGEGSAPESPPLVGAFAPTRTVRRLASPRRSTPGRMCRCCPPRTWLLLDGCTKDEVATARATNGVNVNSMTPLVGLGGAQVWWDTEMH